MNDQAVNISELIATELQSAKEVSGSVDDMFTKGWIGALLMIQDNLPKCSAVHYCNLPAGHEGEHRYVVSTTKSDSHEEHQSCVPGCRGMSGHDGTCI